MRNTSLILALLCSVSLATEKVEHFDNDPGWEGFRNRVVPDHIPTVTQDFGFSATHFAGKAAGEIGGRVWRSTTPASYAVKMAPKTLNDKLSASGVFAITATSGSSGAFLGWFNSELTTGGRASSLGFRFAGEGSGARLTLQLVTAKNQACGTKITPWVVDKTKAKGEGRKFRPTSIKNDGTRYRWEMSHDPDANNGGGQIRFTIRSDREEHEEWEDKPFTVDLPAGYKDHGSSFDRFGITNSMRGGNPMTIYFDDIEHDGVAEDFANDPDWVATGNKASFADRERGGMHDFGFIADAGQIGGTMWRSGDYGYYADRAGPLSLDDRLEASGTVMLKTGAPDSGMYFGWFNSAEKESARDMKNFLGVKIGGPTRVGHYFAPCYATADGSGVNRSTGPVLVPGTTYKWRIIYDPAGTMEVTLADESKTIDLKSGDKGKGAAFDRFGLVTGGAGGSFVKIYFDDVTYTASRPEK